MNLANQQGILPNVSMQTVGFLQFAGKYLPLQIHNQAYSTFQLLSDIALFTELSTILIVLGLLIWTDLSG